jgi:hypothetical protein
MSDADKIAEFLARKGATKCPPAKAGARSLRAMRREHERALTEGRERLTEDERAEREAELAREAFGRARAAGFSVSDALDEAREAGL